MLHVATTPAPWRQFDESETESVATGGAPGGTVRLDDFFSTFREMPPKSSPKSFPAKKAGKAKNYDQRRKKPQKTGCKN